MRRYFELIENDNQEKIETAILIINYAVQDINSKVEELNRVGKSSYTSGYFYELTIKTDHIIHSVEQLLKIMKPQRIKNPVIKRFRLIRSLALAHPLETTRYEEFGFGKDNIRWCEDVRPYNRAFDDSESTDFRMIIRERGAKKTTIFSVNIEEDLLNAARIALNLLNDISSIFEDEITTAENNLKEQKIFENDEELSDSDYVSKCLTALKVRYPNQIEVVEYIDGRVEEYSTLAKVGERLSLSFRDQRKEKKYEQYKDELRKLLYKYSLHLQNMTLEKNLEELENSFSKLLYPSITYLMKLSGIKTDYGFSKIYDYLNSETEVTSELLSQRGKFYEDELSNEEFALYEIYKVSEYLNPFFKIDFYEVDKVVSIQYCVALYFLNMSEQEK